jgi:hypothetical protein
MEFQTEIEEAVITVEFDYQPEEQMVMYYPDGSGDPGSPASVDNISAYWKTQIHKQEDVKIDITNLLEQLGHDVEEMCWDYLNNGDF